MLWKQPSTHSALHAIRVHSLCYHLTTSFRADATRPQRGPGGLRRGCRDAFTVIEATVAGAIITLFLTSLFALNSNMIHMLRAASEAANSSQDLQTRVEQLRLANWNQITNPVWLTANFFTTTDQKINLPGMVETLTVSVYQSPAAAPPSPPVPSFTVTHNADGTITTSPSTYSSTASLQQQDMLQLDLCITWPTLYRSRTRCLTTVVSRWGISK